MTAERHDHAHRIFHREYAHYILIGQRFKVQAIRRIVIGGYGFGVIVDDDHIIAELFERPHAVHGRIIKFNALTDANRAGAEHHDNGLSGARKDARFAFRIKAGIEIRRFGFKFRAAGIDHLKR